MNKINGRRFCNAIRAINKLPKGTYELVIPTIDFKSPIEFNFTVKDCHRMMTKDPNRHVYRVTLDGYVFYVLGDFYNFKGDKKDRFDIARHFNKYTHSQFGWIGEDNHQYGFAYHWRKVDDSSKKISQPPRTEQLP